MHMEVIATEYDYMYYEIKATIIEYNQTLGLDNFVTGSQDKGP